VSILFDVFYRKGGDEKRIGHKVKIKKIATGAILRGRLGKKWD